MDVTAQHYCQTHQTKFFKNEKFDKNGELSTWYSHKLANGVGFCTDKEGQTNRITTQPKLFDGVVLSQQNPNRSMYICNAMNNAVNLASNGAIGVDQIGQYFQKILGELSKASL
jgi:hypothetical protein